LKLLLDEHFDYVIAEQLSRRGVDAIAITKDRPAWPAKMTRPSFGPRTPRGVWS
jgi:hypothetical protein